MKPNTKRSTGSYQSSNNRKFTISAHPCFRKGRISQPLLYIYIIYIYRERERDGGMWRVWGRGEGWTGFWWGNLRKRPLGRPRRRWEDNIKMDLQEVGGGCEDWMELAEDSDRWRALVSTVMNLGVPKMRGDSWLAAEPVSFSRRALLHGGSK